jgi:hypothetical protein
MDEQKEIPILNNGIKIGKVTKIELVNGRINLWAEINKNEIKNKIYERFNGLKMKIDMSAYQDEILPKLCGQYKKAKD